MRTERTFFEWNNMSMIVQPTCITLDVRGTSDGEKLVEEMLNCFEVSANNELPRLSEQSTQS